MEKYFNVRDDRNLTMLMDFYELTMGNGYLNSDMADKTAYFDAYFRRVPDGGGYCIMAGIDQLIEYISDLNFKDDDINYLMSLNHFSDAFLDYLKHFKFECDVFAIPEGNPVFPNEPLVSVRGPVIQAQMVETMILLTINHQTLIATKANRIVSAADGRPSWSSAPDGLRDTTVPSTALGRPSSGLHRHLEYPGRHEVQCPDPGHHGPFLGPDV